MSVKILNRLVETLPDVGFVISSTWRKGSSVEILTQILAMHDFKGEIVGLTPRGCGCCVRGNEIHQWIKDNEEFMDSENSYVIFDDDSDMLWWQRNNFLHIDAYAGITPNIIYKAIRILNGGK